jgi:Family of unknown function (DUF6062)
MTSSKAESESRSYWVAEMSLAKSLRLGDCLVCSNLIHSERHAIFSFLWEGMMSPDSRGEFLNGEGFCARHFWIAKRIEDDSWRGGGIGVAILCENLVGRVVAELPGGADLGGRETTNRLSRRRKVVAPPPSAECMFCRDRMEREIWLIESLEYLKNRPAWSERLERSPLCVRHAMLAFGIWGEPEDKLQLRASLEAGLRQLQADLNEFIRKHDWNHRDEPMVRERDAVPRAIQVLTGLFGQFPFQKASPEGGRRNGTGER